MASAAYLFLHCSLEVARTFATWPCRCRECSQLPSQNVEISHVLIVILSAEAGRAEQAILEYFDGNTAKVLDSFLATAEDGDVFRRASEETSQAASTSLKVCFFAIVL